MATIAFPDSQSGEIRQGLAPGTEEAAEGPKVASQRSWLLRLFWPDGAGRPGKLHSLDLLRVFLTFWIVSYHCVQTFNYFAYNNSNYVHTGFFGVECFFILSGFVLTYVNWERFNAETVSDFANSYLKFVGSRFFRIWPLHALITLGWYLTDPYCSWDYALKDATFADAIYTDVGNHCNAPSWFLHYEIYVCLCLPFVLVALKRFKWSVVPLAAASLVLCWFYMTRVAPSWSILASGSFIRGAALFSLGSAVGFAFALWPAQHALFDLLSFPALYFWHKAFMQDHNETPSFYWPAILLSALIIYCFSKGVVANYVADNPAVAHLAEWSFAIYLVHWAFVKNTGPLINGIDLGSGLSTFVMVTFAHYLMALPVAIVAYYVVENKVRQLTRNWFVYRPARREQPLSAQKEAELKIKLDGL